MSAAEDARRCIAEAEDHYADGNFTQAFDLYSRALIIKPELKKHYDRQFRRVLIQLVDYLEEREESATLFNVYKQALSIFPGAVDILNSIGRFLLQKGCYLEAWSQFLKVLKVEPNSVIAEFQINVLKASLLHRWHYRMLNDKWRNFLYRAAIHESVKPGKDRVLDLGSGTGLLAMYAAQRNPLSVAGIEMNNTLCELAEMILEENNYKQINIIHDISYNVTDEDIGGKHDLLITELFDAGLFGEGVLPSLHHAWSILLHSEGRVLPHGAEYFVRGVQCTSLMTKYYLNEYVRKLLNIPNAHVLTSNDSYDCCDIAQYKDLEYVTEPQSVVRVNFDNPSDIESKLKQVIDYRVELNPVMDGVVDTIVGWLNLHLTDKTSLTTDPTSEHNSNAWQQAVFCNFIPKKVEQNCPITVNLQLYKGQKLEIIPDTICNAKISDSTMRFLNDIPYIEMIMISVDKAFSHLEQFGDASTLVIADLSPFPLFGLMMLKRGIQSLYCQCETIEDRDFFQKVFTANYIQEERYNIIESDETLENKKFHAIYSNIFNVCGNVNWGLLRKSSYMKSNNLLEGGIFMPNSVNVMGQLINSHYLDICNRVYDENTRIRMAHLVNRLQLSANYAVDYGLLDYTALSVPVKLGVCGGMKSEIIDCAVLKDGYANALLCWYDVELLQDSGYVTTKRPNSFIDTIAFLANPEIPLVAGTIANIICCVDEDQSFRCIIDTDND